MMSLKPEPVSAILFLPVKSDEHTKVPPMTFDITGELEFDVICLFIFCGFMVLKFFFIYKYGTKIKNVFDINKYISIIFLFFFCCFYYRFNYQLFRNCTPHYDVD
jgi:Ca2+/Na+ antiporter